LSSAWISFREPTPRLLIILSSRSRFDVELDDICSDNCDRNEDLVLDATFRPFIRLNSSDLATISIIIAINGQCMYEISEYNQPVSKIARSQCTQGTNDIFAEDQLKRVPFAASNYLLRAYILCISVCAGILSRCV
jgi:hypothetical protein